MERSGLATLPLKLRVKEGATASFQCYVCTLQRDGQIILSCNCSGNEPALCREQRPGFFRRQDCRADACLSPENCVRSSRDGTGQPFRRVERGTQTKLDCALQLSRTVALDFNNALTSILGHTSLILSKMEPNHPWRSSLVEVEKSAEKAAETAHDLAAFSRQDKDACGQVAGNLNDLLRRTVELFAPPALSILPGDCIWKAGFTQLILTRPKCSRRS